MFKIQGPGSGRKRRAGGVRWRSLACIETSSLVERGCDPCWESVARILSLAIPQGEIIVIELMTSGRKLTASERAEGGVGRLQDSEQVCAAVPRRARI